MKHRHTNNHQSELYNKHTQTQTTDVWNESIDVTVNAVIRTSAETFSVQESAEFRRNRDTDSTQLTVNRH